MITFWEELMMWDYRYRWFFIAILVVLMVAGCDLFSTRDAEEPEERSDICGPATSSDQVLSVMNCALQFHLPEDYLHVFDQQGFEFVPDGAALSNHQDLLPWGYNEEASHIRRLLSDQVVPPDSLVSVEFEDVESIEWVDSARYLETYILHIGHILEGVPRQATGRSEFIMDRNIDGTWVIRWWRDEAVADDVTWSDIKALIR